MATELAHLAQADRHIARAKQRIRQQEQLIERLIAKGCDAGEAEDFLFAITNTLSMLERLRLLILDRLRDVGPRQRPGG